MYDYDLAWNACSLREQTSERLMQGRLQIISTALASNGEEGISFSSPDIMKLSL